ncbi:hypothetical protein NPIL_178031 [Nephila pilipes]|uniref:Uncharacterized protein n=1 Tax=Nephila pilipes TaxID=299642 RepID=A0A8X6PZL0_NEPPI|nr:hypothetical protein NPIL_178031 [Nephila pilipes]
MPFGTSSDLTSATFTESLNGTDDSTGPEDLAAVAASTFGSAFTSKRGSKSYSGAAVVSLNDSIDCGWSNNSNSSIVALNLGYRDQF